MEINRSSNLIAAGLLVAALQLGQLTTRAVILGPYTADGSTLHLWHIDASAVPVPDAVASGAVNLATIANGATLGNPSFTGFSNALNTLDGGQSAIAAGNKDAYLAASASAVTITLADPTTAAFTMEAVVWIGFDPTKNLGPTSGGGNNRNTFCQIMTGESGTSANRIFQFRIAPIGTDAGNPAVKLTFANVNLGSSQPMSFNLPTTGPDAILSNAWYHVAVAYNGSPNTADNIAFYWTAMDSTRTNATLLGTSSMQFNLPVAQTVFSVGNLAGRSPIAGNFLGLIDEVRISSVARGSNEMMFGAASVPPFVTIQPTNQTVAVGQSATLSVTAGGSNPLFYQWRQSGTNVAGATQATYFIASAQFSNAGPYDVVITNSAGSTNSAVATLTVRTPLNLTWLGLTTSDWNSTDTNWVTDTSANVAYTPGDNVKFDNNGSGAPTVNLTGAMTPNSVVVNAANDYTLSSSVGGGITGNSPLTKDGAGMLVLDTDNSYTGPTVLQNGVVQLGAADAHGTFGTGPVTNNSAIVVNRTGSVTFANTLAGTGSLTNLLGAAVAITGLNTLSGPIALNNGSLSLSGLPARGNTTNFVLNAPAAGGQTTLTLSGGLTLATNVSLSLLGTTDVPDARCNLQTGNDGATNFLNAAVTFNGGSGAIQIITGTGSELDVNSSISDPAFTGKVILRGTGIGHIYGTINLPAANHISTTDAGTWVLHSTGNSWTNSNLAAGTFRLAANNALPSGVYIQLSGTLDLAGFNQTIGGLTNVGTITNSSTVSDCTLTVNAAINPSSFFGVIKDSAVGGGVGVGKLGLTLTGGTLTLAGVNVYAGDTTISAGTLALSGAGTLNSTNGNIIIAAGATFDVSGVTSPPYNMRTHKTLIGGGVSGGATINGALSLNAGSFVNLNYVSGTPAINVTGGALTFNANSTTVTVSGPPLAVGSYKLISASAGGAVAGSLPPSVTVAGSGLAGGTSASLRLTSGELWLDVAVPQPVITSFTYDGTNLIFSGTNGTSGNTYYVLASTNVTLPLTNWVPVFTNVFQSNGVFTVTNPVSSAIRARFYLLKL